VAGILDVMLGWLFGVLRAVVLLLLASALLLALYVSRNWNRQWDEVPLPNLHASRDANVIARGKYLVTGPAHCAACHAGDIQEYERSFSANALPALAGGFPFPLGPLGTIYAKNLTPDPQTGLGRYSDPQIARMLRHGVRPNGLASIPPLMPYGDMSDEDIVAIISYLRTLPPVWRDVRGNDWTLLGKVMKSIVAAAQPRMDVHPPRVSPPQQMTAARGEYLATSVADCSGCHTPYNELTGATTGPAYSGGNVLDPALLADVDPAIKFRPPNITPLAGSALMKFPDRATFIARFKNGGRKFQGSPMPWEAYARMTPEDVGALYEYLLTVPPAGAPAPEDPTFKPAPES
jgi:mono/diheme cytochrome c family protein